MNDIQRIPLVSIDVIKTRLDGIDNKKLIDEILNTRGDIDESYLENEHHTYYEDKRYPFGQSESEKLIERLGISVSAILGRKMVLSEIWTLTLEYGQSVAAHSHKSNTYMHQEEYYSIAYYPSAPADSADLIFLATACNTVETSVLIKPQTGDLVIFNSYLMHMTNRHRNMKENRIVISANFVPEVPNATPSQDWSAYSRTQNMESESKYLEEYEITAYTVFGEEKYTLGRVANIGWEVSGLNNTVSVDNVEIANNEIIVNSKIDIPMTTNIYMRTRIDDNLHRGILRIGDFMTVAVSLRKIR